MGDPVDSRARLAQRVRLLDGVASAITRRDEVMDLVSSAASPEGAIRALVELLDVDDVTSRAITELQLRRFTLSAKALIDSQLSELRRELGDSEY